MTEWSYQMFVFLVAHLIAMSSTVYNPFVYAWFNDTFRTQFQKVVPCCRFATFVASDSGRRCTNNTNPSPSRFATGGGWSSADTNQGAITLSAECSARHDELSASAAAAGPPIELTEVTPMSTVLTVRSN